MDALEFKFYEKIPGNSILMPSFRVIANFRKKTRFLGFDQNYLIHETFKKIYQFFSFSPKPLRSLNKNDYRKTRVKMLA